MSKEIKLIDFAVSEDILLEDRSKWTDCVTRAIQSINVESKYIYLMSIDVDDAFSFRKAAQNLSSVFKDKGVDNIVFVPKNRITLSKIEVIHS